MKRNELETWLTTNGWKIDKWSHYHKLYNAVDTRMKMQATSVRYEVKSENGWIKLANDYYKNLTFNEKNELKIGPRILIKPRS